MSEDNPAETAVSPGNDDSASGEKKVSIFRKPMFWIISVATTAILVIGGTLYYLHARQFETTDNAFVDAHIVRIAPEVSGTLVEVADLDNRHVKAGQLLAVIKPSGPEAQLAQAQAGIDQAMAQFSQAQAQIAAAVATRDQT